MKILMIGPDDTVRGGMTAVQQLYRQHWQHNDCNLRYIGIYCSGSKAKKLFLALFALKIFWLTLIIWRPTIVHVHFSWRAGFYRESIFTLIAILLRPILHHKVIMHAHAPDFDGFYQQQSSLLQRYIRAIFGQINQLIVLSDYWKTYYRTLTPYTPIWVLYNPVEIPENPVKFAEQSPFILTIGELGQRKGTYDLITVMPPIIQKYPDAQFYVAGNGEVDTVQQHINKSGIKQHVTVPGWIEKAQKHALLQRATMFVLPSYHEGFSMAIIEAMSYGLPIITTQLDSLPRLLKHQENVLLISPGNTDALRDSLITLLHDKTLRRKIGNHARQTAQTHFDVHIILQQLYENYQVLSEQNH